MFLSFRLQLLHVFIFQAAIIAFTSEFVPKLVYQYGYNHAGSLEGYVNFSLSVFDVSAFENDSIPREPKIANVTLCRCVCVCFSLSHFHLSQIALL